MTGPDKYFSSSPAAPDTGWGAAVRQNRNGKCRPDAIGRIPIGSQEQKWKSWIIWFERIED